MPSDETQEFYLNYCGYAKLQSLEDLSGKDFTISSSTSDNLNVLGYIEIDVNLPGASYPIDTAFIVTAGSILNEEMPELIGSNGMERWKYALMPHSGRTTFIVDGKTICASVVLPRRITVPATVVQSDPAPTSSTTQSAVGLQ